LDRQRYRLIYLNTQKAAKSGIEIDQMMALAVRMTDLTPNLAPSGEWPIRGKMAGSQSLAARMQ
jgi:hypothetical protein